MYINNCQVNILSVVNCFDRLSSFLMNNGYSISPVPTYSGGHNPTVNIGKCSVLIYFIIEKNKSDTCQNFYDHLLNLINKWFDDNNYSYLFVFLSSGNTYFNHERIKTQNI